MREARRLRRGVTAPSCPPVEKNRPRPSGTLTTMASQTHWEDVYTRKKVDEVSWYRPHLDQSLELLTRLPRGAVIDVGAGASTLVDDLLARGYGPVTVNDLSATALATSQRRLGDRATAVHWVVGDIISAPLPAQAFDLWHDRAVFHFLRTPEERARYVAAVRHALKPGGHLLVATFGPEGPTQCSGLEVCRYSADALHAEFGADFAKLGSVTELHQTPSGKTQQFVYCLCQRT
mgnify:CR=1 FL=1